MYQKVATDMGFVEREKEVLEFWKENQIFRKSIENRRGCPEFTFYDGPPTANGKPHIGHILTRVIKDIIPRFQTMKGRHVLRKAGWDTHGLPVELEVEKMLGINGKPEIEAYGVEAFIRKCRESVWKYKAEWEQMSDRVGFWADMENPYITYENNYIESEWWALRVIWDKGPAVQRPQDPCRIARAAARRCPAMRWRRAIRMSGKPRFSSVFRVSGEPDTWLAAWTTTPLDLAVECGFVRQSGRRICPDRAGPRSGRPRKADALLSGRRPWPRRFSPANTGSSNG